MALNIPARSEIYWAALDPVVGRKQAGRRPFLILSVEGFNHTEWQIVIGVPLTTTDWANPSHIRIEPVESGLRRVSYAMPEMVRSISIQRLQRRAGRAPVEAVDLAAKRVAVFTGLGRTRH
jgi:mRNA interferase MazF